MYFSAVVLLYLSSVLAYIVDVKGDCLCNRAFNPICGSDGTTYANKCDFGCFSPDYVTMVKRGVC